MPPDAHTKHDDSDDLDASDAGVPGPSEIDTVVDDGATVETTIGFELNFNAYADNVPPTRHARRVVNINDPSAQDFADQALELATLRAELKRLNRDYDSLQRAVRLRDERLQTLRNDLAAARAQLRDMGRQLSEVQSQSVVATKGAAPEGHRFIEQAGVPSEREVASSSEVHAEPELSPTRKLPKLQDEASATISQTPPVTREAAAAPLAPQRRLIPADHDGDAILLSRDVTTIGRTSNNNVCIPSRAVSRDHARLLISASGVTIIDMDSANGCFVNGQLVKRQRLRVGDVLRIGDRSYHFTNDPAPAQQRRDDSAAQ